MCSYRYSGAPLWKGVSAFMFSRKNFLISLFGPSYSLLKPVALVTTAVWRCWSSLGNHGYRTLSVTARKQMKAPDLIFFFSSGKISEAGLLSPPPAEEHAGSTTNLHVQLANSISLISHQQPDSSLFISTDFNPTPTESSI